MPFLHYETVQAYQKMAAKISDIRSRTSRGRFTVALKPEAEKKAPIKFKDAIGRKFSFPFHLCATWAVSFVLPTITCINV
jgi:hypothetical protein